MPRTKPSPAPGGYPPIKGTIPNSLPQPSLKPRKSGVSPMDKRYQGA